MSSGAAIVRRCTITPGTRHSISVGNGCLEIYDSVIGGGRLATIFGCGETLIRNSHILEGDSLAVTAPCLAALPIDLKQNWWATTDTSRIWAKIEDPYGVVTIDPIAQQPLPTQQQSVGSLKGMFRSGQ